MFSFREKKLSTLLFLAVLPALGAAAGNSPPVPRLGAPLVTKLNWNIGSVAVADIDGDGKNDLALLNNDTGRIELLYQRRPGDPIEKKQPVRRDRWTPDLEDALFRRDSVSGDAAMLALAVGDLNGDGLADIAFTSERSGLNVVFQGPKGEWGERLQDRRLAPVAQAQALQMANVDGAGHLALVALTKRGIAVYALDGKPFEQLPEPRLYRTDGSDVRLAIADIAGTGRPALATVQSGQESIVRVRFPQPDGTGFGPEVTLRVPATGFDFSTPLGSEKVPEFVAVNPRQRQVGVVRLARDDKPLRGAESAAIHTYSPENDIGAAAQVASLDVDGDGITDLVVADAKAAQLLVYRGSADGDFQEAMAYPSLAEISAMAPVSLPGQEKETALLVLSKKEGVLGVVVFEKGRPAFPVPVMLKETPLVIATFAGEKTGLDVVLTKDDKGTVAVQQLKANGVDGQNWKTGDWALEKLFEIEASRRDVVGLEIADLNGDGRPDILAFVDRDPVRIFVQGDSGSFSEVAKGSAFRKSLLDGATPAELSLAAMADPAQQVILVAAQGYVRALRLDDKNDIAVVFQANSQRASDRLRAPLLMPTPGGAPVLLAYNETAKALEWFEQDDTGVYRSRHQIELDGFSPLSARLQSVPQEATPRLLYLTKERIVSVPTARRGWHFELRDLYESDQENFVPRGAVAGRFSAGESSREVVLLDPVRNVLQMIQPDTEGHWRNALHFVLFDGNPHYRGQRSAEAQPREYRVADVTGDGLEDLILLMHDRVFVYPQQREE